jgi:glucose/arabinose dehydrogenase
MYYFLSLVFGFSLFLVGCEKPASQASVPVSSPAGSDSVASAQETQPVSESIDYASEEAEFQNADLPLDSIQLPDGFSIEVVATNIENARSMVLSPQGTLYVGTRKDDKVYALEDRDQNGKIDKKTIVAAGLDTPNGVALKDGDLYVAENSRLLKFKDIENTKYNSPDFEVIYDAYPTDEAHGWKYIAFGPNEKLYVPVGAPCNICDPEDPIYASITQIDVEAEDPSPLLVAEGVRNSVGFDWHPGTEEMWFTDNGRDWLGDNWPPDELNRLSDVGQHFGYPFCHGNEPDPEFGERVNYADYQAPAQALNPHGAALGMKFYTGNQFPSKYKDQIFIAEHGSWNRTIPIGYQVSLVRLNENNSPSYESFATGWLQDDGESWGRPVDVIIEPSGALLVSDAQSGTIYRIQYDGS